MSVAIMNRYLQIFLKFFGRYRFIIAKDIVHESFEKIYLFWAGYPQVMVTYIVFIYQNCIPNLGE